MGRNDKGLVTYDRKIKKDAFYFYKANWNQEDKFVYIAGKRLVNRTRKTVDVQVFSNSGAAKLYINGKAYGTAKPDSVNVLEWKGIVLDTGENRIEVGEQIWSGLLCMDMSFLIFIGRGMYRRATGNNEP